MTAARDAAPTPGEVVWGESADGGDVCRCGWPLNQHWAPSRKEQFGSVTRMRCVVSGPPAIEDRAEAGEVSE